MLQFQLSLALRRNQNSTELEEARLMNIKSGYVSSSSLALVSHPLPLRRGLYRMFRREIGPPKLETFCKLMEGLSPVS
jgi:hypothetical protein